MNRRAQTIKRLRAQGARGDCTAQENRQYGWHLGRNWVQDHATLRYIRRLVDFAGNDPAARIRFCQNDDNKSIGYRLYSALTGRENATEEEAEEYWQLHFDDVAGIENPALATGFLEGAVEAWSALTDKIRSEGSTEPLVYGPVDCGNTQEGDADRNDPFLSLLRTAITLCPQNNGPRLKYGQHLEERGEYQAAAKMLEQVADPSLCETVPGASVGIPHALTATVRRGFAASIVIRREHLRQLHKILPDHPIETIGIAGSNDQIVICHEEPGAPQQLECTGKARVPDSGLPPMWVVVYRGKDPPGTHRRWSDRDQMVASVGVWLDGQVPRAIDPREPTPPE